MNDTRTSHSGMKFVVALFRVLGIAGLVVALTHTVHAQGGLSDVAIERLKAYPETYSGKQLTFNNAEIRGNAERHLDRVSGKDYFAIGATLVRDGYISGVVGRTNLAFTASDLLGGSIVDGIPKDGTLRADLLCRLQRVADENGGFWVIRIRSISLRHPTTRAVLGTLVDDRDVDVPVEAQLLDSAQVAEIKLSGAKAFIDRVDRLMPLNSGYSRKDVAAAVLEVYRRDFAKWIWEARRSGKLRTADVLDAKLAGIEQRASEPLAESASSTAPLPAPAESDVPKTPEREEIEALIIRLEAGSLTVADRRRIAELLRQHLK